MKYIMTLLLGLATGVAVFAAGLAFNPFARAPGLSPLAVTDAQTINLTFSDVSTDSIVFTNNGESRIAPYPQKVQQLWEASIRQTSAHATVMLDVRNQPVGYGVKIASLSENTDILRGKAIVDSVWYIHLPGRGGLFVEQTENYWDYLRDIVLPAYRSSGKTWSGSWLGNLTAGPGALATAKITGLSGEFAGMEMLGVESLAVKVWRVDGGAMSANGQLLIELPIVDVAPDSDGEIL